MDEDEDNQTGSGDEETSESPVKKKRMTKRMRLAKEEVGRLPRYSRLHALALALPATCSSLD